METVMNIINVKMSNRNVDEAGYRDLQGMLKDGWVTTWNLNVKRLSQQHRIKIWNVGQKQILDASIREVVTHPENRIILGDDANIVEMTGTWMAGPRLCKYTEE